MAKRRKLHPRLVARTIQDHHHPVRFPSEPVKPVLQREDPEQEPDVQPFKLPILIEQLDDQPELHIDDYDPDNEYLDMSDWQEDFD